MKVKEEKSFTATTVKALMTAVNMGKGQLTDAMVSGRTMGGGNTGAAAPDHDRYRRQTRRSATYTPFWNPTGQAPPRHLS